MDHIEQLKLWVNGESIHNEEKDECCPDFSCCSPNCLASLDVRKSFYKAYRDGNEKLVNEMLFMFLGNMFKNIKETDENKIYISGSIIDEKNVN